MSFDFVAGTKRGPYSRWFNGASSHVASTLRRDVIAEVAAAFIAELGYDSTHTAAQLVGSYNDAASNGARSVLFRNGTIYVGNGQFWRQDNMGNTFGPH